MISCGRPGELDYFKSCAPVQDRVLCASGEKLCEKWHIFFPVNPDTPYFTGEELFVHSPVTYLEPTERWKRLRFSIGKDSYKEFITHVDGKLVLMIDMSYSTDQIKTALDQMLSFWTLNTKSRAKRSTKADIWEIYDLVGPTGKISAELTRKYVSAHTEPGLNVITSETDMKLMQTSYAKAVKIIKAVEKRETTVVPRDPMKR